MTLLTPAAGPRRKKLRPLIATGGIVALVGAALLVSGPATAATPYTAASITVGDEPTGVAFTPDGTKAYVATDGDDTANGSVAVVNTATGAVTSRIPVGEFPSGLAITPDGTKAYVTNEGDNTVSVINVATGTVTQTITVGDAPFQVGITPDGTKAFVVNLGDTTGSVSIIDTATGTVTATTPLGVNPQAVAFSPSGTFAYIPIGGDGTAAGVVDQLNVSTGAVAGSIPVGTEPDAIAITPDGSKAYVANWADNNVDVINLSTNAVIATIPVGEAPNGIAASPDGTSIYTANGGTENSQSDSNNDGSVSAINVATEAVSRTVSVHGAGWFIAVSPDSSHVYMSNVIGSDIKVINAPALGWTPTTNRLSGVDRYATSVAVAQAAFPTTASVVYIATGFNFPDALGAAAVAAKKGGPLLLTSPTSLPENVSNEIQSLQPGKIVVVGGTGVVSDSVLDSLTTLANGWGGTVTREAGADRYGTAAAVINSGFAAGSATTVYIATGSNYPDALSASAAAGAHGEPVVLVNGSASSLDAATLSLLQTLGATNFLIAGGTGAVSAGIATQLGTLGTVSRYAGADRYSTSELINKAAFTNPSSAYFATGLQFPDALSGAVLAGVSHAPLYVVQPTCVPNATENDLAADGTSNVTLIGGAGALSANVATVANCAS